MIRPDIVLKDRLEEMGVILLIILAIVVPIFAFSGCKPASVAEDLRAGVVLVAEGVKSADSVCADVAEARNDIALAKTCAKAYDSARPLLESAETSLDAAQTDDAACKLAGAVQALFSFQVALQNVGVTLPPMVRDAIAFGSGLSGLCRA